MSINGALNTSVSALTGFGNQIGIISDNISNISTVGFKGGASSFRSLVTTDVSQTGGAGITAENRIAIDRPGLLKSTGVATDIAISGGGMFVVKDKAEVNEGSFSFTRAGSFRQDDLGFFRNAASYVLQAWPLDADGRLPGAIGNANTTSSQLLESLESVNTRDISGIAFATTSVSLGLNLDAGEALIQGATDTFTPGADSVNSINNGIASDDVIAQTGSDGGADGVAVGDIIDVTTGSGLTFSYEYGGISYSDTPSLANPVMGATSTTAKFTAPTDNDNFTITTTKVGTVTYTFKANQSIVTAELGEFNSLTTLAAAINATTGMSARIAGDTLWVAPDDANEIMTFADVTGTISADLDANNAGGGTATWVNTVAGTNRFASLDGLAALVNTEDAVAATISNPANAATLDIYATDITDTINFEESTTSQAGAGNFGSMKLEFGLQKGTEVLPATTPRTFAAFTVDPVYNASASETDVSGNMANGKVSPNFSRNVRVFDSLGNGHDLRVSFLKRLDNTWLVEVYAANPDEIISTRTDGQIVAGTIRFNGDGTLLDVDSNLSGSINVVWSNAANSSNISLDLGDPTNVEDQPVRQLAGNYLVQFADQNGAASGLLSSVEITDDGFVVANFSNGESRNVYQIPIASFQNENGLTPRSGNVYESSDESGDFTLNTPGDSSVGTIASGSLENANVELADQLTNLIVAQRAFQSNTKVITVADELLEELNRI